jgi:transposase-like protein
MLRRGRSDEEIIHALHHVEGGETVAEVWRRLGISEQTFYRWKKQAKCDDQLSLRRLNGSGSAGIFSTGLHARLVQVSDGNAQRLMQEIIRTA